MRQTMRQTLCQVYRRETMGVVAHALEYWMRHAGCYILKKRRNSNRMAIYNCFS